MQAAAVLAVVRRGGHLVVVLIVALALIWLVPEKVRERVFEDLIYGDNALEPARIACLVFVAFIVGLAWFMKRQWANTASEELRLQAQTIDELRAQKATAEKALEEPAAEMEVN